MPLVASVVEGRLIAGASLPLLLVADVFAVSWYRHHTRWDLLEPLAVWVAVGFGFGIAFFIAVGNDVRLIDVAIGVIILVMVAIQLWRMVRRRPPQPATARDAVVYGSAGGFTTFVSNSAGPVMNTYLVGFGLDKDAAGRHVGVVLLRRQPRQDPALHRARLPHDRRALLHRREPAVERCAWCRRSWPASTPDAALLPRISQETFVILVLVLSALGGLRLLWWPA